MSVLSEFKGNVNLSSDSGTSTTVGTTLNVNTVQGKAVGDTLAIGNNLTTGTITIGTALDGTTSSNGLITIGSTTATSVITTAELIKQIVPAGTGTGTVEVVYGNANNVSSLSTTFNRKVVTSVADQDCYTIVSNGGYSSQYFEIVVSGSNDNRGGYSYKGCFILETNGGDIIPSDVTTLFFLCGLNPTSTVPSITFGISGTTATLRVNAVGGIASPLNQRFMTTLIAYPTVDIGGALFDYAITAI